MVTELSTADKEAIAHVAALDPIFAQAARDFSSKRLRGSLVTENQKNRWTARELALAVFPEPVWAVPGLIPYGLTFISGRPKLGKSWLALQLAHAVGTGGQFLGIPVEQGGVLLIALEDSPRRLQDRAHAQKIRLESANITFALQWRVLQQGGLDNLYTEIASQAYRLIIIDTLTRAVGRLDQKDPGAMTEVLGSLQQMVIQNNMAAALLDHHNKPFGLSGDPIDDITQSTAKAAVADNAIGLYREQGKKGEVTLKARGRDVEAKDIVLGWDGELSCWQNMGDAEQVRKESRKGKILQALVSLVEDGCLPTIKNVTSFTGIDSANISHDLIGLTASNQVQRGMKIGREVPYYPIIGGRVLRPDNQ